MKTLTLLVLFTVVAVALTGCGTANQISATPSTTLPCDLSSLKIKSIVLMGDQDHFVERALKSKLYKLGAKNAPTDGAEIVGSVEWGTHSPYNITVEVPSLTLASTATTSGGSSMYATLANAEELAEEVANDFCECFAGSAAKSSEIKSTKKE